MLKKPKKDKSVTLSFPKFFSLCQFSVPEDLRIFEISFAILLTKMLIDNRKGVLYLYQKRKR